MTRPPALAAAFMALGVASCAGFGTPASSLTTTGPVAGPGVRGGRPTAAAIAACGRRADEIYLTQNRGLLSERNQSFSPYSSTGLPDNPAQGLGELFGRDQNYVGCLRSYGPASPSGAGPAIPAGTGAGVSPAMTPNGTGGPVTVGPPR